MSAGIDDDIRDATQADPDDPPASLRRAVYTTGQVARICRVAPRTVSQWCDRGRLKHHRLPDGTDRRIIHRDLIEFLNVYGMADLATLAGISDIEIGDAEIDT